MGKVLIVVHGFGRVRVEGQFDCMALSRKDVKRCVQAALAHFDICSGSWDHFYITQIREAAENQYSPMPIVFVEKADTIQLSE